MEKLQHHFSQTSRRVRENRIKAAMHKPREPKPTAQGYEQLLEKLGNDLAGCLESL